MAYCTITDIQALNPTREYSDSTTPTTAQVTALMTQVMVEIDAVLQAKGYTIPVTAPENFVNLLKYINAYGAAALADKGMYPETSEMGQSPHWKILYNTYQGWLKDIKDGKITPESLGSDAGDIGSNYTEMANQDGYPEPKFRISSTDKEF